MNKKRMMLGQKNSCIIFDNPKEKGIEIIMNISKNTVTSIFMSDKHAQEMINIIQNKINSRLWI